MLVLGEGQALLQNAGIPLALPSGKDDPGLLVCEHGLQKDTVAKFAAAIAKHRHFERAMDPPPV
jgi:catalase